MSNNNKYTESDPERTLLTLDQLSQTIEVMTSVVNRLRQHLSEQILARKQQEQRERDERDEQERKLLKAKQTRDAKNHKGNKQAHSGSETELGPEAETTQLNPAEGSIDRESFVVEISQPETETQTKSTKTLH